MYGKYTLYCNKTWKEIKSLQHPKCYRNFKSVLSQTLQTDFAGYGNECKLVGCHYIENPDRMSSVKCQPFQNP